eukprot:CAMPEP_0205938092 /NCGR_PEP_ID=MMETSP1325-20131115/45992_1 /ASSEMBLY_ACC=CAM_ASM_000708 /TAXON_ID=236786 /ORGANISM="Florenciella sp., Strain RCC1007" /LENGTH=44 /DNA_ID= /DNA_START= /DNA_END= /DNA_ORIENTATION=
MNQGEQMVGEPIVDLVARRIFHTRLSEKMFHGFEVARVATHTLL